MAKKFYAVKTGRTPGIYGTWDECKAQVDGYSGAKFKGFGTESEARDWLSEPETTPVETNSQPGDLPALETPYAFTDGSYNIHTGKAGWGGFLVLPDGQNITLQGAIDEQRQGWNAMRNVAGEICGVMSAIAKAQELGLKTLHIYYDYAGVELWTVPVTSGGWEANKPETRFYQSAIQQARANGLDIKFHKVKAHTGIPGNEEADRLAKQAIGVL